MSETLRVEGIEVNVDSLFNLSFDFSHLRVTIKAIIDALGQSNTRVENLQVALHKQNLIVENLNTQVNDQASKLSQATSTIEGQGRLLDSLFKSSEQTNAKLKNTEQELKQFIELNLPKTVKNHEERIEALEKENKALKTQMEKQNEKAASDAAAAAAQQQASQPKKASATTQHEGLSLTMSENAVTPVVVTAPLTVSKPSPVVGQNFTILETQLNKLATNIDGLTGRVAMIETSRAVPTPTHIHHASSELDPQLVENLTAQEAQTQKQLHATLAELKQVQTTLKSLEKNMNDKASVQQLDLKADKKDVVDVIHKLTGQGETLHSLDRATSEIRSEILALQQMDRNLNTKLSALLDVATCGLCKLEKPTSKCAKCNLSFCDKCDEQTHGPCQSSLTHSHTLTHTRTIFISFSHT